MVLEREVPSSQEKKRHQDDGNTKHQEEIAMIRTVFLQWLPWILKMSRPGKKITRKTITLSNRMKDLELKERSSKSLLANVLDIEDDLRHCTSSNSSFLRSKVHHRYRRRTDLKHLDEETKSDSCYSDQSNQAFAIEKILLFRRSKQKTIWTAVLDFIVRELDTICSKRKIQCLIESSTGEDTIKQSNLRAIYGNLMLKLDPTSTSRLWWYDPEANWRNKLDRQEESLKAFSSVYGCS
ncbi:unnamed protein product [Nezara viridula]|uniref:Uncharacterized protein n=1 Tax=Nezara viridula TaxID=85310 RepID=A0A9P0E5L9_NEZVI|nr:unnamed protein product [Nezara viridula]